MSKIVKHKQEARDAVLRGVDILADAVKVTEGPRGRNVILGQRAIGQSPKCTKDGVTVANYTDPSDPFEQLGSDLIREAAQKTDNAVGDGTTASIVLAQAMIHAGFDLIKNGANPMAMERGMHKATEAISERVIKMSVPVEGPKVFQVATVSAHGDTSIGSLVANAIEKSGLDGVVTVEPSTTADTKIETVIGLELEKSNIIHPAFFTHPESMTAQWSDCKVLLWEGVIGSAKSLVPILAQVKEAADRQNVTPLLIVAGGYEQEALAIIINQRYRIALPILAVRMEAYGQNRKDLMGDIAALTGGKAFFEDSGVKIEKVTLAECGTARKVITDMRKTQIIEGRGNAADLQGRVQSLRDMIAAESIGIVKTALQRRLAALLGGITIIKVGGVTVTEMEERRDRVVDALGAAKAAVESGVVAGGGMALFRASSAIHGLTSISPEEVIGAQVVQAGCFAILQQIAENAGVQGKTVLSQAMATTNLGYNAMTGKFEDLVESGIIDPTKVVIESLKNAVAVSCSILTMGAAVAEKPNDTRTTA